VFDEKKFRDCDFSAAYRGGMVWYVGMIWHGIICMVLCGVVLLVWCDMVWYYLYRITCMVLLVCYDIYGMIWYGMVLLVWKREGKEGRREKIMNVFMLNFQLSVEERKKKEKKNRWRRKKKEMSEKEWTGLVWREWSGK
jgi:hypothetical protein